MEDGLIHLVEPMRRRQDADAGPDPYVASDGQTTASVEEALRANPRPIADHHACVVVALQDGLVPDVDVRADLDILRMKDQHPVLEDDILTNACQLRSLESTRTMAATNRPQAATAARRASATTNTSAVDIRE